MRLMRALVILAVVAALWGAPSSVSAAANQLASPQVSPGSGTVATVFTFRVRYEGTFAATSVSVSVAGLTLPMALESGTLSAGWWATWSPLPVGAWSTTFRSTASRGPAGTVDGPIVVVAAPFTPTPTASGVSAPPSQGGATPESAPVGDSGDGATASAAPDAAPDEASATSEASPAPDAAPAAPGDAATDGATDPAPGGGSPADPAAGGGSEGGDEPPADGNAPVASLAGAPSSSNDAAGVGTERDRPPRDATASADDLVSTLLLLGLAGVASVAIIGTLLLVAGRRREPEQAAATAASPIGATAARPIGAHRQPMSPADDPIVAALGVDDEMAARRAIRRARSSRETDTARTNRPRRR